VSRYGLFGKLIAQPGRRDALAALLLEAAALLKGAPGCEQYIVSVSEIEPEAVWVSEVWATREAQDASLAREDVRALIGRGRELIAGMGERFEVVPLGGVGL
jgi:quinol monooxygenase YgiN